MERIILHRISLISSSEPFRCHCSQMRRNCQHFNVAFFAQSLFSLSFLLLGLLIFASTVPFAFCFHGFFLKRLWASWEGSSPIPMPHSGSGYGEAWQGGSALPCRFESWADLTIKEDIHHRHFFPRDFDSRISQLEWKGLCRRKPSCRSWKGNNIEGVGLGMEE